MHNPLCGFIDEGDFLSFDALPEDDILHTIAHFGLTQSLVLQLQLLTAATVRGRARLCLTHERTHTETAATAVVRRH